MKLLAILAGLLWMCVFTTSIPLDAVRKNLTKISDLSEINAPAEVPAERTVQDKDDEISALIEEIIVPDKSTQNSTKTDAAASTKAVKSGKKKPTKPISNPFNANASLHKKVKTEKRKLKAKINYSDPDDVVPVQNKNAGKKQQKKIIDFSDIDDALPDRLKKKFEGYVKHGFGKNVDELKNIHKKLKILRKITGDKPSANNKKNSGTNGAVSDTDDDNLLFDGDQELDEAQLDSIIASTARHYGVDMESLKKFGIKSRPKRQATRAPSVNDRLWPQGSIRYYYDDDVPTKTKIFIDEALKNIENQTCLQFTKNPTAVPRVQFVNSGDKCSSPVGYYNGHGIHHIKIANCLTNYGTISHEILHVIGIEHQQDRSDRDDYLTNAAGLPILDETNSYNFGSPYDYGSVMHYFSNLITTQPLYQGTIGHRVGPSFIDIAIVNHRYNCFCEDPTVTCLNGGYPDPNNCDRCICPHGYGSRTCSAVDPGTEEESERIDVNSYECETFERSLEAGVSGNDYNFYKNVWFQFKAPSGKKIQFIFVKGSDANGAEGAGCDHNGVEVKITKSKFNRTGLIFCGDSDKFISDSNDNIKTFTTSGNMGMVQLYTKEKKVELVLKYRYIDSDADEDDDEVPASCAPVPDDDDCENIWGDDADCENWAANPNEDCEADPNFMLENCAKTCGNC